MFLGQGAQWTGGRVHRPPRSWFPVFSSRKPPPPIPQTTGAIRGRAQRVPRGEAGPPLGARGGQGGGGGGRGAGRHVPTFYRPTAPGSLGLSEWGE